MVKKIFGLSLCIILLLNSSGCNKEESNEFVGLPYVSKCVYVDKEDGWFDYFCIELSKKDEAKKSVDGNYEFNQDTNYIFDGINLKYQTLDDHYIPIYDKTNKEVDKVDAPYPSLSVSATYRDEMKRINTFFNNKKFAEKITGEDLKDLQLDKIDKETLVNLFNMAYEKDPIELGEYINIPSISIKSSILNNDYQFQVGYFAEYGNIIKINIEVLYEDGTYLSDLISNDDSTNEQDELYKKLNNIEDFIIYNQKFDISKYSGYNKELEALLNLMNRIENENE